VITGAASGIGLGSAVVFAREGAKVVIADVDEDGGKQTVTDIQSIGGDAIFARADVSKSADVQGMIKAAVSNWGKLDALYNNAGIENDGFVADYDEETWTRTIDVNLKGAFLGAKYAFRQIMKQGSGGSIINTSSVLGLLSMPGCCAYSASKSGIIGLTRALALDGGPIGIRVNCICPGYVLTRLTKPFLRDEDDLKRIAKVHPISRIGEPEEIGKVAAFLASDDASFVTGSIVSADGGISALEAESTLRMQLD
jgi:NAD(P)-dependent dehydrogenase (short-subunit alcohol dehydrogenase family)